MEGNSLIGFFPANHVQLITNDQKSPAAKAAAKVDSIEKKMTDTKLAGSVAVPQEKEDSSEDETDVPPGWHIVHTSDNAMYYWNEETGETCWELPGSPGKVKLLELLGVLLTLLIYDIT